MIATTQGPTTSKLPHRTMRQAFAELWGARDILANMVRRDFASKHKNSFLGVAWSLVTPLLLVGVFTIVFQYMFRVKPVVPYPYAVFFFGGLVIWNLFANSVTTSSAAITANAFLVQKVYIPRELFPFTMVLSTLITFVFEFAVLVIFMLVSWRTVDWSWTFLLAPIFVALVILWACAISLFVSALSVQFRDVEHFIGVAMQTWFFLSPVMWDYSMFGHGRFSALLRLNPMSGIIVGFRDVVLNGRLPDWPSLLYAALGGLILFFFGYWFFNRQEPMFPELI